MKITPEDALITLLLAAAEQKLFDGLNFYRSEGATEEDARYNALADLILSNHVTLLFMKKTGTCFCKKQGSEVVLDKTGAEN